MPLKSLRLQNSIRKGIRLNKDGGRDGDRVLVASGTTSRNRDYYTGKSYRVIPAGVELSAWRKNPLVLWHHNFQIPVGLANIELQDGQLWGYDIRFHRRTIPIATQNWIGDAIGVFDTSVMADLWVDKWLNATSIHIMFNQADEANILETDTEVVFATSEMLEFSLVTIPGDRDSVRPGGAEAIKQRMIGLGVSPALASIMLSGKPLQAWKQPVINLNGGNSMSRKVSLPLISSENDAEFTEDEDGPVVEITESADVFDDQEFDTPAEIEIPIDAIALAVVDHVLNNPQILETLAGQIAQRVQKTFAAAPAQQRVTLVLGGSKPQAVAPRQVQRPVTQSVQTVVAGGPSGEGVTEERNQVTTLKNGRQVYRPSNLIKRVG